MKKILITGGTGLLGKEIVKGFLEKNCSVYYTSTSKKKSEEFLKEIKPKYKKNCIPIIHQFNDFKDINNFISKYNNLKFDTLINNARNISNLNLNVKDNELFNSFNEEIFLAVYLPYFLSVNLNNKNLNYIVNISSMYGIVPPNKNLYKDKYKYSGDNKLRDDKGETGEDVEFEFGPNPGEPMKPLRQIASSGEISRVMLSVRVISAPK